MYAGPKIRVIVAINVIVAIIMAIAAVSIIPGCTKEKDSAIKPIELTRSHTCVVCGMILLDFPGAKGQIHYSNGKYDTFCGTVDLFTFYLQPDSPKDVAAIYVNDMGKADWKHPTDNWIDAKKAFYVYGGQKHGAMGDYLVPFLKRKGADDYVKEYGGEVITFNDITMELLKPLLKREQH